MPQGIRQLHEARGLSHTELGRLAKVSRTTLYLAEAGDDRVKLESLIKIARALEVPLRDIAPEGADLIKAVS